MKKTIALLAAIAVLGILVANATVYSYRWLEGTVTIEGTDQATGAACTGFYSSTAQSGIPLPEAGTNYQAATYGSNQIQVTTGEVSCQIDTTYSLYESISVSIPITVGSWYLKDIYGFGYYGDPTADPQVSVYIGVKEAVDAALFNNADLLVYKDGSLVATIDLTATGGYTEITLNPGEALQLDFNFTAIGTGTANFQVDFYVSQTSGEPPR